MTKKIHEILYRISLILLRNYLKWKKKHTLPSNYLYERSLEYSFTLNNLINYKCLNVIDIGTGSNSFAETMVHCGYNVVPTDYFESNYWSNFSNRHSFVINNDITNSKYNNENFDAVTCISVL